MKHDEKQFNNLAYHPKHQDIINNFQRKLKSKLEKIRDNDLGISY